MTTPYYNNRTRHPPFLMRWRSNQTNIELKFTALIQTRYFAAMRSARRRNDSIRKKAVFLEFFRGDRRLQALIDSPPPNDIVSLARIAKDLTDECDAAVAAHKKWQRQWQWRDDLVSSAPFVYNPLIEELAELICAALHQEELDEEARTTGAPARGETEAREENCQTRDGHARPAAGKPSQPGAPAPPGQADHSNAPAHHILSTSAPQRAPANVQPMIENETTPKPTATDPTAQPELEPEKPHAPTHIPRAVPTAQSVPDLTPRQPASELNLQRSETPDPQASHPTPYPTPTNATVSTHTHAARTSATHISQRRGEKASATVAADTPAITKDGGDTTNNKRTTPTNACATDARAPANATNTSQTTNLNTIPEGVSVVVVGSGEPGRMAEVVNETFTNSTAPTKARVLNSTDSNQSTKPSIESRGAISMAVVVIDEMKREEGVVDGTDSNGTAPTSTCALNSTNTSQSTTSSIEPRGATVMARVTIETRCELEVECETNTVTPKPPNTRTSDASVPTDSTETSQTTKPNTEPRGVSCMAVVNGETGRETGVLDETNTVTPKSPNTRTPDASVPAHSTKTSQTTKPNTESRGVSCMAVASGEAGRETGVQETCSGSTAAVVTDTNNSNHRESAPFSCGVPSPTESNTSCTKSSTGASDRGLANPGEMCGSATSVSQLRPGRLDEGPVILGDASDGRLKEGPITTPIHSRQSSATGQPCQLEPAGQGHDADQIEPSGSRQSDPASQPAGQSEPAGQLEPAGQSHEAAIDHDSNLRSQVVKSDNNVPSDARTPSSTRTSTNANNASHTAHPDYETQGVSGDAMVASETSDWAVATSVEETESAPTIGDKAKSYSRYTQSNPTFYYDNLDVLTVDCMYLEHTDTQGMFTILGNDLYTNYDYGDAYKTMITSHGGYNVYDYSYDKAKSCDIVYSHDDPQLPSTTTAAFRAYIYSPNEDDYHVAAYPTDYCMTSSITEIT